MREVGPHLDTLYFFNYGDPFLHPQAAEMLALAKLVRPEVVITTSTNGIPLMHMDRAIDVVRSGVDEIIFTIGGAWQASYERYHIRGRLKERTAGNGERVQSAIGLEPNDPG